MVALRGTATNTEWWDDLHWDLVPFTQVSNGGKVAQSFLDEVRRQIQFSQYLSSP